MAKKVVYTGVLFFLMLFAGNLEAASKESLEKRIEQLEKKERSRYKKGESEILVYFKNGFKMRSRDNQFKFQAGGRIMHDWGSFAENQQFETSIGNQENGARFRRVRFFMAGMLYKSVKFMFDIDVDGGASGVTFKDMYISFPRIPVLGNFQVGHFKRPASLDSVSSSKYLAFIERSLANTFFKTRNVGFAFFNQQFKKRLTWFVFANKETSERPPDFTIDGDWNVTSRLTGLPFISRNSKRWLHLGASWSYEEATNNKVTFNAARDSEITGTFLTTGEIETERFNIIGLEGAYNWNQFSVQSEYALTDVERGVDRNGLLDAFYIEGSWYLTGEYRRYNRNKGAIARFRPNQNFNWNKKWSEGNGTGALQLAVRYSELDLNDSGANISGGEQKSFTVGLNWELNPVSRIMYNFVHAKFYDGTGADSGKLISNLVRFQVDF